MKHLSIRAKIALWSAALVGVVVLTFAVAVFLNLYHEQIEEVDLELDASARHLGTLSDQTIASEDLDTLIQFEPWISLAIIDADGGEIRRSKDMPASIARSAVPAGGHATVHSGKSPAYRLTSMRHGASNIIIAYSLQEVDEIISDLVVSFLVSLPVVLVISALGGWFVSGRALSGLKALAVSAETIRADQLHLRIPSPPVRDEIRRLVDVLNAMLGRLETSFRQSQHFAADASHELRTPLAILSGEIAQLLREPNLSPEAESKAVSIQEEIGRLQHITDEMLLLAKFDAAEPLSVAEVNLSALVSEACEDAGLLAEAQKLSISSEVAAGIHIRGEAIHLRRLLLNLLQNAVRYNREGGRIHCSARASDRFATITIGNTGPTISLGEQGKLFERFYRGDAARGRGGHGLGLSLCKEIVARHGGTIRLASSADDWTEFVVELPL